MADPISERRIYIGAQLRRLREERGLSQAAFADHLQLSQTRLSAIERGQSSLTAEEFLEVLRIFNVPASDFLRATVAPANEQLKEVGDRIREALIAAESPRHLTALAPILVLQFDEIDLRALRDQLFQRGHLDRLFWLVEKTRDAIVVELHAGLTGGWSHCYRRVLSHFDVWLQSTVARPVGPFDLQVDDFRETLRASRER